MKIGIIKYNAGNTFSVSCALNRIGITPTISDDTKVLSTMDKIIFPGVGSAASAMKYLKEKELDLFIKDCKKPLLGICLGLQLLCEKSEEGDTECLGIFPQNVKKFRTTKVPQIGWNKVKNLQTSLFTDIPKSSFVYFVHSYYAELGKHTISSTTYEESYSSALNKDNFYATQFHPEKSADIGEKILQNFVEII